MPINYKQIYFMENGINLQSTAENFIISIDKNFMDKVFLMKLLDKIRIEYLARKIAFDDSIEDLGEEIKQDWWEKNKARLLS